MPSACAARNLASQSSADIDQRIEGLAGVAEKASHLRGRACLLRPDSTSASVAWLRRRQRLGHCSSLGHFPSFGHCSSRVYHGGSRGATRRGASATAADPARRRRKRAGCDQPPAMLAAPAAARVDSGSHGRVGASRGPASGQGWLGRLTDAAWDTNGAWNASGSNSFRRAALKTGSRSSRGAHVSRAGSGGSRTGSTFQGRPTSAC